MKAGNLVIAGVLAVVAYMFVKKATTSPVAPTLAPPGTVTAPSAGNGSVSSLLAGLSSLLNPKGAVPNNQSSLVGLATQAANRDQVVTPNYISDIGLSTGASLYTPPGAGTLSSQSVVDGSAPIDWGDSILGDVT